METSDRPKGTFEKFQCHESQSVKDCYKWRQPTSNVDTTTCTVWFFIQIRKNSVNDIIETIVEKWNRLYIRGKCYMNFIFLDLINVLWLHKGISLFLGNKHWSM